MQPYSSEQMQEINLMVAGLRHAQHPGLITLPRPKSTKPCLTINDRAIYPPQLLLHVPASELHQMGKNLSSLAAAHRLYQCEHNCIIRLPNPHSPADIIYMTSNGWQYSDHDIYFNYISLCTTSVYLGADDKRQLLQHQHKDILPPYKVAYDPLAC